MRFYFFIIYLIVISCSRENEIASNKKNKTIVEIIPFNNFSDVQVNLVAQKLSSVFDSIIISKTINIPNNCFYEPRQRYRADSILRFLHHYKKRTHHIIGLTNKDISITKNDIKDYGIMGLSYTPGLSSVVSGYRLKKENLNEQLTKVVLHELGHAFGLQHCKNQTCFMQDANGKNKNDSLTGFCNSCKKNLIDKGWKL